MNMKSIAKTSHQKSFLLASVGLFVGSVILLTLRGAWPQAEDFHHFADTRNFLGIANFMDIFSNILFSVFGGWGLWMLSEKNVGEATFSWKVFFLGVFLVGPGSAFYHSDPTNFTLIWDRLPMTLAFMSVFSALLTELFWPRFEKYFLLPLLFLGMASVFYWYWTETQNAGDLRFYAWVQGFPLTIIPFAFWLGKKRYTHYGLTLLSLTCYVLAKLAETYDEALYFALEQTMSGHTLKHLLAAAAALGPLAMLKQRDEISQTN